MGKINHKSQDKWGQKAQNTRRLNDDKKSPKPPKNQKKSPKPQQHERRDNAVPPLPQGVNDSAQQPNNPPPPPKQIPKNYSWVKPQNLSQKWDPLTLKGDKDLTFSAWNVQGLGSRAKRAEIGRIMDSVGSDIIAICEHHKPRSELLDDDHFYTPVADAQDMKIKTYHSSSTHCGKDKGGGTALYWKAGINAEVWEGAPIPDDLKEASLERTWIKIQCNQIERDEASKSDKPSDDEDTTKSDDPSTLFVCAVYMPTEENCEGPHSEKFAKILSVLDKDMAIIKQIGAESIFLGDFNSHLGDPSTNSMGIPNNNPQVGVNGRLLSEWLRKWGKTTVNSQPCTSGTWTRAQESSKSILDLIIVDNDFIHKVKALIIDDDRELASIPTDHNPLICLIQANYHRIHWDTPELLVWDLKHIKKDVFDKTLKHSLSAKQKQRKLTKLDKSVETVDQHIKESIEEALNMSTKKIPKTCKTKTIPKRVLDLNEQIKLLEKERSSLLKGSPTHRATTEVKNNLKHLTKQIQELIKEKFTILQDDISTCDARIRRIVGSKGNKSKKFWSEVKNSDKTIINSLKKKDGTQTKSQDETIHRGGEHFEDLFSKHEHNPDPANKKYCKQFDKTLGETKFLTKHVTTKQIILALKKLKLNKAAGPDGIPNEVLKLDKKVLSFHLTQLFNLCLDKGQTPTSWGKGIMHILYKGKGDTTDLKNYRGLTVNNSISKVFTTILYKRLLKRATDSGALGHIQHGARPGMRATDSLFVLRTIIEKAGNEVDLNFIDLTKAYDTIPHENLFNHLLNMGLHKSFVNIIKSLYANNTINVMINGHASYDVPVLRGIKQGCVLSPLLFALYVSSWANMLEQNKGGIDIFGTTITGLFFVDDLVLIAKNMTIMLELIDESRIFLDVLGMNMNFDKTKLLTTTQGVSGPSIEINDDAGRLEGEIKWASEYKYLGLIVSLGSPAKIFNTTRKKMISRLKSFAGSILQMARNSFDPISVGITLWKSVALPAVLYGVEITSLDQATINKLESIQSEFSAHLLGLRKTVSASAVRSTLGIKTIETEIIFKKLKYWNHLKNLKNVSWAHLALSECERSLTHQPLADVSNPTSFHNYEMESEHHWVDDSFPNQPIYVGHGAPHPANFISAHHASVDHPLQVNYQIHDDDNIDSPSLALIGLHNTSNIPTRGVKRLKYLTEIMASIKKVNQIIDTPISVNTEQSLFKSLSIQYSTKLAEADIESKRIHSLKHMPRLLLGVLQPQPYLELNLAKATIISKFRLGDCPIGRHYTPPVITCPACKKEPNNESHLVFRCKALQEIRDVNKSSSDIQQYLDDTQHIENDLDRLKLFLGGDRATNTTLANRSVLLSALMDEFVTYLPDQMATAYIRSSHIAADTLLRCSNCNFSTYFAAGLKCHITRKHNSPQ